VKLAPGNPPRISSSVRLLTGPHWLDDERRYAPPSGHHGASFATYVGSGKQQSCSRQAVSASRTTCNRPRARRRQTDASPARALAVSCWRRSIANNEPVSQGTTTSTVIAITRLSLAPEDPEVRRPAEGRCRLGSKGAIASSQWLLPSATGLGQSEPRTETAVALPLSMPRGSSG
jgi:hypothetical protein